ncbi:MAG: ribosome-associated translation inhibitor RaiA [Lachnospiraceae bacterium]|nr:ribosome-associated translation inhibitor RaiA [Lachnospiraceae bacterium]
MNIIISGKNIDITKGLKEAVEEKLSKLEKYFLPDTDVNVTLSVEKLNQTIEVTIPVKGSIIRAEQTSDDMYVTIDLVVDIIDAQMKKYRQKLVTKQQASESFKKEYIDEESVDDTEIPIVRTKKFGIKPMFPEDACVEMEMLGHSFFVFSNAETGQVNVVYKRKDGKFGLIEPEF